MKHLVVLCPTLSTDEDTETQGGRAGARLQGSNVWCALLPADPGQEGGQSREVGGCSQVLDVVQGWSQQGLLGGGMGEEGCERKRK